MTDAGTEYPFEGGNSRARRDAEAARRHLQVLWRRLGGQPAQLAEVEASDRDGWLFLVRYATDGPLNIDWYEKARPDLERKQKRHTNLVLALVLVLFSLAFLLPFQPLVVDWIAGGEAAERGTGVLDLAALVGVLTTGITLALRLSGQAVRYRQQAAAFHRASASLKEQLYRLEDEWRGQELVGEVDGATKLVDGLRVALRRAVIEAQAIQAEEREQFFDTLLVDVNALTDTATGSVEALASRSVKAARRQELQQEHREIEQRIVGAEIALGKAKARLDVLEAELQDRGADPESELALARRDAVIQYKELEVELQSLQAQRSAQ